MQALGGTHFMRSKPPYEVKLYSGMSFQTFGVIFSAPIQDYVSSGNKAEVSNDSNAKFTVLLKT